MPLRRFIDVVVNNNFSALIITGFPPQEELIKAWEKIYYQYNDAIGDHDTILFVNLFKEISLLTCDYEMINKIADSLIEANYNEVFFEPLYNAINELMKSNIRFSTTNFEYNITELNKIKNKSKSIKIRIDLKQIQLDELLKAGKQKKHTEAYFQSVLISLSDHAKYHITDSITVFEYCERIKRLNAYINLLMNRKNGSK